MTVAPPLCFAAVLLAAGRSTRMGAVNKLLIEVGGMPMVRRTATAILESGVDELVVVTGHERAAAEAALAGLACRLEYNPDFEAGQVTSVRAGLGALSPDVDVALLALADQPLIEAADYRRLMRLFAELPGGRIGVPMVSGRRGNPILLPATLKDEVLSRGMRFGCRHLIEDHPDLVAPIDIGIEAFVVDFDTPEAFAEL